MDLWILYTLEASLKAQGTTFEQIATERQSKACLIMDAMEKWMEAVHNRCTPNLAGVFFECSKTTGFEYLRCSRA